MIVRLARMLTFLIFAGALVGCDDTAPPPVTEGPGWILETIYTRVIPLQTFAVPFVRVSGQWIPPDLPNAVGDTRPFTVTTSGPPGPTGSLGSLMGECPLPGGLPGCRAARQCARVSWHRVSYSNRPIPSRLHAWTFRLVSASSSHRPRRTATLLRLQQQSLAVASLTVTVGRSPNISRWTARF